MLIIMTPLYCDHHRLEIAAKSGKKIKRQSVVSQGEMMMIRPGTCEAEQFSRRETHNVMYVMLLQAGPAILLAQYYICYVKSFTK